MINSIRRQGHNFAGHCRPKVCSLRGPYPINDVVKHLCHCCPNNECPPPAVLYDLNGSPFFKPTLPSTILINEPTSFAPSPCLFSPSITSPPSKSIKLTMRTHSIISLLLFSLAAALINVVIAQDVCGDGICSGTETLYWCARDCLGVCGDGTCSRDESFTTCPDCFCTETDEEALARMINVYRRGFNLPDLTIGIGTSRVAQTHARDSAVSITNIGVCNQHSWSGNLFNGLNWTSCCFTADGAQNECMFQKPRQISRLTQLGVEISGRNFGSGSAVLQAWQATATHNDVILNRASWANFNWRYIGVGINPEARWYHVWFYAGTDDIPKPGDCNTGAQVPGGEGAVLVTPSPSSSVATGGMIETVVSQRPSITPSTSTSASMSASMTPSASPSLSVGIAPPSSPPSPSMTVSASPTMTMSSSPSVSMSITPGLVNAPNLPKFLSGGKCNPNFFRLTLFVRPHRLSADPISQNHLWTGDFTKQNGQKYISLRPIPYTILNKIDPNYYGRSDFIDGNGRKKKKKNKKNKNKKNTKKKNKIKDKRPKVLLQYELCGRRYVTVRYYFGKSQVYARKVIRKTNKYSGNARDNLQVVLRSVFGGAHPFKEWYHSFLLVQIYVDRKDFGKPSLTFKLELTTKS